LIDEGSGGIQHSVDSLADLAALRKRLQIATAPGPSATNRHPSESNLAARNTVSIIQWDRTMGAVHNRTDTHQRLHVLPDFIPTTRDMLKFTPSWSPLHIDDSAHVVFILTATDCRPMVT